MQVPATEIIVSAGGAEILRKTVRPGDYVIGREPECEVQVAGEFGSRRHAQLTVKYDHALIEDLGSSNGTFVNGKAVTEPTRPQAGERHARRLRRGAWRWIGGWRRESEVGSRKWERRRHACSRSFRFPTSGFRLRRHPGRFDHGHAAVHRPRAGSRGDRRARCAQRHLRARRDSLSPAPSPPGRDRRGRDGGRRESRAGRSGMGSARAPRAVFGAPPKSGRRRRGVLRGGPAAPPLPGGARTLPRPPDSLLAVVRKAMSLDREQRYASVADLLAEITAYRTGFATGADHAGLGKQLVLLIKRHKGAFGTAAAAWFSPAHGSHSHRSLNGGWQA